MMAKIKNNELLKEEQHFVGLSYINLDHFLNKEGKERFLSYTEPRKEDFLEETYYDDFLWINKKIKGFFIYGGKDRHSQICNEHKIPNEYFDLQANGYWFPKGLNTSNEDDPAVVLKNGFLATPYHPEMHCTLDEYKLHYDESYKNLEFTLSAMSEQNFPKKTKVFVESFDFSKVGTFSNVGANRQYYGILRDLIQKLTE